MSKTLETTFVNFSLAIKPCNFPHALVFLGKGQRHDASCIICVTLAVAFLKDHSVPVSGVSIEIISEIILNSSHHVLIESDLLYVFFLPGNIWWSNPSQHKLAALLLEMFVISSPECFELLHP